MPQFRAGRWSSKSQTGRSNYDGGCGVRRGIWARTMTKDALEEFESLPGRLLLDTCILNQLYEEGEYIWDYVLPEGINEDDVDPDLRALQSIFRINQRANFQFLVSPLTIAEVANIQDFPDRESRLRWILDVLNHWLIMLDQIEDRVRKGGTVRHRFKLTGDLQDLESSLIQIPDFRRDPFDRLLLLQYRMANCDAFLTMDRDTIWCHRAELARLDIRILTPSEFWELLKPWATLWY